MAEGPGVGFWTSAFRPEILPDPLSVARRAAEIFTSCSLSAIAERQSFTVALSGGNTPRLMYSTLANSPEFRDKILWSQIHLFWSDERHVPPDHQESNYRMANETLLSFLPIPPRNIHRVHAELEDPTQAAALYEMEILEHAATLGLESNPFSLFDLILLGMGPDGHTASLFPQTAAITDQQNLAVSNWVPKLNTHRITLTPPVLIAAHHVLLLITGQDKARTVQQAFNGPRRVEEFPVQLLASRQAHTVCLFDTAASTLIA